MFHYSHGKSLSHSISFPLSLSLSLYLFCWLNPVQREKERENCFFLFLFLIYAAQYVTSNQSTLCWERLKKKKKHYCRIMINAQQIFHFLAWEKRKRLQKPFFSNLLNIPPCSIKGHCAVIENTVRAKTNMFYYMIT